MRVLPLAAVSLVLLACLASSGPSAPAPRPRRVLFIGNSLTAVNDVPGLVAALASAAGKPLHVEAVTLSGASLDDHWQEGSARRRLAPGGERWDVVILQQGPSSRPESRELLRKDAIRWAAAARAAGAEPALYMVWPIQSEPERWDDVRASYKGAADAVGGLFLPAGEAWREAARLDPGLALYSADGLHPTLAGSYAAALVIHARLGGGSPLGAPALGVDAAAARTLQRAAAAALARD